MIKVSLGDAGNIPNSDMSGSKVIFLVPGIEPRDTQPLSHIPNLFYSLIFILILKQGHTKLLRGWISPSRSQRDL